MSIKLISWNINMFNPDKPENEKDIITELSKQINDQDIIVFIESSFDFIKRLLKSDIGKKYKVLEKFVLSHGGLINILYNNKISDIKVVNIESPILLINFNITKNSSKKNIFLGGCHLAPFPENSERRIEELMIARSAVPPKSNLILIGDMNIREKETKFMDKEDNILQLKDSGDKKKTWFRSFFDQNSYNISSRFDRLFISPGMKIDKFELFGKKYLKNENKFLLLSDHLAIKTEIYL